MSELIFGVRISVVSDLCFYNLLNVLDLHRPTIKNGKLSNMCFNFVQNIWEFAIFLFNESLNIIVEPRLCHCYLMLLKLTQYFS